ncbi:MAG: 2-succinyl-5-enolpyruvyl-6-hydroxy-3-cyclohexene-1-carboxylic-acid synthase [Bdellovibrionales bacterium]|nr:2-succinyl-5-enolpyruvyl-6-hydroxy-3-cyclohexene-1-carboxylic-acid synthase [Bdellovibrionales bacterium]
MCQSLWLIEFLSHLDCTEVVLCAGARNAALILALEKEEKLKLWHFYEERDASFFALGRIKALGQPVAVLTTSGTAAAELIPATIEAYYSGLKLLLITADRPSRFRNTGAPQAIEQVGIFSHYAGRTMDLEWTDQGNPLFSTAEILDRVSQSFSSLNDFPSLPVHINICLEEPELSELKEFYKKDISKNEFCEKTNSILNQKIAKENKDFLEKKEFLIQESSETFQSINSESLSCFRAMAQVHESLSNPLVIIGPLPLDLRKKAIDFLKKTHLSFYAESLSNLKNCPQIKQNQIQAGELTLKWTVLNKHFSSVIRIGGVPTVRLWRDLEKLLNYVPVLSFSHLPFSGLSKDRKNQWLLNFDQLLPFLHFFNERGFQKNNENGLKQKLKTQDEKFMESLKSLCAQYPLAEPVLCRSLSQVIPKAAQVYLGNSLPIREWDLMTESDFSWWYEGNRGANGIDGQLSTFFGFSEARAQGHWAILGDLTTLYNLSAPWVLREIKKAPYRIVVINNYGGKIFERMFAQPVLENHHALQFEYWAKMWGMEYIAVKNSQHLQNIESTLGPLVVELLPDVQQTRLFWKEWELLWKK